jgi:dipeptidyl-peptidase-4
VLTYLYSEPGTLDQRLYALELDVPGSAPVEIPVGRVPVGEVGAVGGSGLGEQGERRASALSLEEQLRRERAREVAQGVTVATWAAEADALVVPQPDGIYVVTGVEADPRRPSARLVVPAADGPIAAARISPDGTKLAVVRAGDLEVVATVTGSAPALRLTATGTEGLTNGCAEFVAQEEMGRADGLWWSPDSAWLAYTEVDERRIPPLRIVHQGLDAVGPDAEEVHRYPFAGMENARVRLGVVSARGGRTVWMDTGDPSSYLARVDWTRAGGLVAQVESRDQKTLRVVLLDPESGASSTLLV